MDIEQTELIEAMNGIEAAILELNKTMIDFDHQICMGIRHGKKE